MKNLLNRIRPALCLMLIALLLSAQVPAMAAVSGSTSMATSGSKYVVTASRLNFRTGPGTGYSIITALKKGTGVTYVSYKDGWWQVRTSNGTTGYVDRKYLAPASTDETGKYLVTASTLNIRKSPKTTAGIAGTVSRGTVVTISQLNGDWGYVSGGAEAKGWVALKYVSSKAGSTASATTYTVTASILNVRSGSSTRYSRIDKLYKGAEVAVTQIKGNWGKVRYSKSGKMYEGWVSLDYLKAS